jgi:hypothetical protein
MNSGATSSLWLALTSRFTCSGFPLNDPVQQWYLAFCLGGEKVFAKHEGSFVTCEIFATPVHTVQAECAGKPLCP